MTDEEPALPLVKRGPRYRKEYAAQARKYALLGATREHLAENFEVTVSSIDNWMVKHPEFRQAVWEGREIADAKVAESLYQRALGYTVEETHVSNYRGEITLTPVKKHFPPDATSMIFWLKNRQRGTWRDRHEHSLSGNVNVVKLLDDIDGSDTALPTPLDEVVSEQ